MANKWHERWKLLRDAGITEEQSRVIYKLLDGGTFGSFKVAASAESDRQAVYQVPPAGERWRRDDLQFPRLLAEVQAVLEPGQYKELSVSMDLSNKEVEELFDRADTAWERIKSGGLDAHLATT